MNIFSKAVQKMLPQLDRNAGPRKGSKDEKIAVGFQKIEAFIARGIDRNPVREVYQKDRSRVFKYPNHDPKVKRVGRAFFRSGDLGHFGPGKPIPFSYKEMKRRGI